MPIRDNFQLLKSALASYSVIAMLILL